MSNRVSGQLVLDIMMFVNWQFVNQVGALATALAIFVDKSSLAMIKGLAAASEQLCCHVLSTRTTAIGPFTQCT